MPRLITIFILLITFTVNANSLTDKLKDVSEKISNTKQQLSKKLHARQTLQEQLCSAETNINKINNQLYKMHNELEITQADISSLEKKQLELNLELKLQESIYTEQLQADYMITPQSRLKLLLNQQGPNQVDRYLTYATYLSQHLHDTVEKLKTTKQNVIENEQKLTDEKFQLKQQQDALQQKKSILSNQHDQRETVLNQLKKQIANKKQQLSKLSENKLNLEKILTKLKSKYISQNYFKQHKKQLPWPTKGSIITEFGSPIEQSQLHWNGVIIAAKKNTPVRAVAPGEVIFSDWMPGYGLVLIIDHGSGFMTVYGRNSTVYKGVGDFAQTGETIAQVGKSGGYKITSLYFSIRHNTKALNPCAWCMRHG